MQLRHRKSKSDNNPTEEEQYVTVDNGHATPNDTTTDLPPVGDQFPTDGQNPMFEAADDAAEAAQNAAREARKTWKQRRFSRNLDRSARKAEARRQRDKEDREMYQERADAAAQRERYQYAYIEEKNRAKTTFENAKAVVKTIKRERLANTRETYRLLFSRWKSGIVSAKNSARGKSDPEAKKAADTSYQETQRVLHEQEVDIHRRLSEARRHLATTRMSYRAKRIETASFRMKHGKDSGWMAQRRADRLHRTLFRVLKAPLRILGEVLLIVEAAVYFAIGFVYGLIFFVLIPLVTFLSVGLVTWVFIRPIQKLARWIRRDRATDADIAADFAMPEAA